jgi:hypothetical protein
MKNQFTFIFFVLLLVLSTNCLHIRSFLKIKAKEDPAPVVLITPTSDNTIVLGEAATFAVLAGARTTNAGATTVTGSLGVSPLGNIDGTAVTQNNGVFHAADSVSLAAQTSLTTAYNTLAGEVCIPANNKTGTDLVGLTLVPGVYKFNVAAFLSAGTLTLDGDANARWVFQIGTTLITAVNSKVVMINSADPLNLDNVGNPLNVYWQVGTSASIFGGCAFKGNIVAYASISFGVGATLEGRALARTGSVTMLGNTINAKQA